MAAAVRPSVGCRCGLPRKTHSAAAARGGCHGAGDLVMVPCPRSGQTHPWRRVRVASRSRGRPLAGLLSTHCSSSAVVVLAGVRPWLSSCRLPGGPSARRPPWASGSSRRGTRCRVRGTHRSCSPGRPRGSTTPRRRLAAATECRRPARDGIAVGSARRGHRASAGCRSRAVGLQVVDPAGRGARATPRRRRGLHCTARPIAAPARRAPRSSRSPGCAPTPRTTCGLPAALGAPLDWRGRPAAGPGPPRPSRRIDRVRPASTAEPPLRDQRIVRCPSDARQRVAAGPGSRNRRRSSERGEPGDAPAACRQVALQPRAKPLPSLRTMR